jgi:putative SOS response-associated peptidase YedK
VSRLDRNLNAAHVARRDSLEGTWREDFGRHHGVIAVESMFESVAEHRMEQRALATVDHELRSDQAQTLFLPCIWSPWESVEKPDLWFFAIVVDTAPDDLRALGLYLWPIMLKREHVTAWLHPNPSDLSGSYGLLEDRPPVRYEITRAQPGWDSSARPAPTRNKNLWKPAAIAQPLGRRG